MILSDAWTPPVVREHDETIMDAIADRCSPNEFTLAMANSVRIYLKVITVADISDMGGNQIEPWARNGVLPRNSSLQWPKQPAPTREAIRMWCKMLQVALGTGTKVGRKDAMPLRVPLGRWLRQSHIQYETYWDEQRLYVRRCDGRFDMY